MPPISQARRSDGASGAEQTPAQINPSEAANQNVVAAEQFSELRLPPRNSNATQTNEASHAPEKDEHSKESTAKKIGKGILNRLLGAQQSVMGVGQILGGVAVGIVSLPVGVAIAAKGFDNASTGVLQVISGKPEKTATYLLTKKLSGSDAAAALVDFGTDMGSRKIIEKVEKVVLETAERAAGQIAARVANKVEEKAATQLATREIGPNGPAHSAAGYQELKKELASLDQMSQQGTALAGAGTDRPLRAAERLAAQYGGSPTDYAKMSSTSYSAADGLKFQTHWYENVQTGERMGMKSVIIGK